MGELTAMWGGSLKGHQNLNYGNLQLFIILFWIIFFLIILIALANRLRSKKNWLNKPNVNHGNAAGFSRYRASNLRRSPISLRGHHRRSSDLAILNCSPSSAAVFRLLLSSPRLIDSPFCDRQPQQSFNNNCSTMISVEDLLRPYSPHLSLTHSEQTTLQHFAMNQAPPAYAEVVKPPPSYQELTLSKRS